MFYLVGISGENGVGKTTLAQQIVSFSDLLGIEVIHESFATPIRYAARALGFSTQYGKKDTDKLILDVNDVYHVLFNVLISEYCYLDPVEANICVWNTIYTLVGRDHSYNDKVEIPECTCREFMIAFGESCKNLNKNIWLEALIDRILATNKRECLVVVDDVRFGNEAKMCDKVIHLQNKDCPSTMSNIKDKVLESRIDVVLDVNDTNLLEKVFNLLEHKIV